MKAWGALLAGLLCACVAHAAEPVEPSELEDITTRIDAYRGDPAAIAGLPRRLDAYIAAHPDSSEAWRQYARFYIVSGFVVGDRYAPGALDDALSAMDQAARLAPAGDPGVDILRGHVLQLMGRLDEADTTLARAERNGGDRDPWLRLNRADLRMAQQRWADAMADCTAVGARKDLTARHRRAVDSCRLEVHRGQGDIDAVERDFRKLLSTSDDAWTHGDFARFLLCARDDDRQAEAEARKALALMDYPNGRWILAATLARRWSRQVAQGKTAAAAATFDDAEDFHARPIHAYLNNCRFDKESLEVARAAYDAGRLPSYDVRGAVAAAAEAEGQGVFGVFRMRVQAHGRADGLLYLNSETDYRDPRNLSLDVHDDVQRAWQAAHGASVESTLMGKEILVIGEAERVRIDFRTDGKPTGKYYYQTHLWVHGMGAIVVAPETASSEGRLR
jgi:tetratricopeptide (TPR) repeat protein